MSKTCLVLTGGGARAAYQVGVLKAIASWYPRVHHSPFNIICGTSAGGINAVSLACYNSSFRLGVKKLEWLWARLHTERIFAANWSGVSRHIGRQWLSRMQSEHLEPRPFGLFDNRPLRHLLNQVVNYSKLEKQIHQGSLDAISITTSRYHDGHAVTFYQGNNKIANWRSSKQEGVRQLLHTEHLLASSAIPLLFPASRIDRHYYGDGSIHQLAPLKPAIEMGADKILVIDLINKSQRLNRPPKTPGLAQLGGHLMDTIFSDSLEADLCHMQRLNEFIASLSEESRANSTLRTIDNLHLSPQLPFEPLAEENYCHMPQAARLLLRMIGISPRQDAAITSYILFESDYIQSLIRRGFDDTIERETEIKKFLS
uniref:patatin-like phospholipase family protein n=1 Tax=Thaumasiovibrio subtropicus TaxID=1891207 RepID=UPI000B36130B|nr:patatin-like phospholipase family protein [Thaumasiovibrio subtropicus]